VLETTDHNLSRIFSPSTNIKVDVYVLTPPNARAKIHPRGYNTPRQVSGVALTSLHWPPKIAARTPSIAAYRNTLRQLYEYVKHIGDRLES
jgi:hypothetical protein